MAIINSYKIIKNEIRKYFVNNNLRWANFLLSLVTNMLIILVLIVNPTLIKIKLNIKGITKYENEYIMDSFKL